MRKSYHEIMEHIEVTDEMRNRILENLSSAESAKQTDSSQKIRHFSSYLQKRLALAACAAELSKKAGFPVQDIESLPFIPTSTTYSWCWDIFAEITYESSSNTAWYRKTTGTEDISGDYTDYDQIMTETINGSTVTLKGNDDSIFLAVWQKDGYSSSLNFSDGISLDSIARPKNNAKKAAEEKTLPFLTLSYFLHTL